MKKNRAPFYIAAAICIAVGLALCLAAYAVVRGDFVRLSTAPPYEAKEVSYPAQGWTSLAILDRNTPVRLERSPDDQIHITYFENQDERYRLSDNGGELRMEKLEHKGWIRFVMNFNLQDTTVVVALPEDYTGNVSLITSNADISARGLSLPGDVSLQTTNAAIRVQELECTGRLRLATTNNAWKLEHVTAAEIEAKATNRSVSATQVHTQGSLNLSTTNGAISLEDVSAAACTAQSSNNAIQATEVVTQGRLELRTTNNTIRLERVQPGSSAELVTTNGAIRGSILDRADQYTIESRTTNASNNLPEHFGSGPKRLTARTTNGKIAVDFVE